MKGLIILTFSILIITLFSCKDKTKIPDHGDSFYGNWRVVYIENSNQMVTESYYYSDVDILNAKYMLFEENGLISFENQTCSDQYYEEYESQVFYDVETISLGPDIIDYNFYQDTLTISEEEIGGESFLWKLVKCENPVPPAEWSTIANDDYEPDSSMGLATSILIGQTGQIHIIDCNDRDYFYFNADSGMEYSIEILSDFDNVLTLGNFQGDWEAESDDDGENYNAKIVWVCDLAGSYYISAEGYDEIESGMYQLTVQVNDGQNKSQIHSRKENSNKSKIQDRFFKSRD